MSLLDIIQKELELESAEDFGALYDEPEELHDLIQQIKISHPDLPDPHTTGPHLWRDCKSMADHQLFYQIKQVKKVANLKRHDKPPIQAPRKSIFVSLSNLIQF